ncbi:MAG: PIG-L family deacetylase [Halothiobacillaceae bacterium]
MNRRLRWSAVYRLYEGIEPLLNYSVAKEDKPRGQRVVVLAPHIDDETIGCGGVMAKHAALGDRVAVLTFADCTPERIAEGRAAGRILGVQRQDFLPYPAKTLMDQADLPRQLADFLAAEAPDVVYTPGLFDRHVDHLSVNLLLARHSRTSRADYMVYSYEVWNTLLGHGTLDYPQGLRGLRAFNQAVRDADVVLTHDSGSRHLGLRAKLLRMRPSLWFMRHCISGTSRLGGV